MKRSTVHGMSLSARLRNWRCGASAGVLLAAVAAPGLVMAQDAKPADDSTVVVVTGFRGSLQSAISEKKKSTDMVDVIKAEDIGQFPDLNLAESLQRIPGIAIDRDGGEGRQITVRGLNSDFSRTRLNGLEALATTGGKDSSGGTNRGRGFDYNVFASDLFNSITVRKSLSAEVEEGSLGATIDLQTARPFDYKGFTMAAGVEYGYNDLSKKSSPRETFMISNRWADGKLGALLSVAYGTRTVVEGGPNTTRWENSSSAGTAGKYESYSTNGGTTFSPIGSNADSVAISNSLHPRIPRYNSFTTDQKRLGVTGSFQMRPNPDTLITLDGMYARFDANREEHEIEAISFSRSGQGLPKTDVYNYTINDQGTMVKGSFNDVDVRAEHRYDELSTTFQQLNLSWDQHWSDRFTSKVLIGASDSKQSTPEQTTFTLESYNVKGYSYDYTDMTHPVFNYGTSSTGCSPDQACYWTYSTSTAKGDASLIRIRPQSVENKYATARFDAAWDMSDVFTLKFGASTKAYDFTSLEYGRYTSNPNTRDENAAGPIATAINADIAGFTQLVTVSGNTYLVPDLDKIRSAFNYNCNCTNAYGTFTVNNTNSSSRGNNSMVSERDKAAYVQLDWNTNLGSMPFRGNFGVRQVTTRQTASGYLAKGSTPSLITIEREYKDTLPALNMVLEPHNNLFVRFAAAKTMARPTLSSLAPGGSVSTSPATLKTGNPYLDPVRANTMDLSLEWYPDKDTLASVAWFQKDIKSYIQSLTRTIPFSETGYDPSLLTGTNLTPSDSFDVTQPVNTPGGTLKGYELNLQKPFSFLPGVLSHTGGIVNYTHVESKINYVISSTAAATTYRQADLVGLSPESWNVTLYYDDSRLAGRVSVAHRADYISQIVPGSSADYWGKHATTNVDAQLTYSINRNLTVIAEGINLTNEADNRFIAYNTAQGNTAGDLLYDYSNSGRQYYLGLRYKY